MWCSGPGVRHSIWSWRYGVWVQACPSSELATWLGKTGLTLGGAGVGAVGARGRGRDEGEEGVLPLLKSRDPHLANGKKTLKR